MSIQSTIHSLLPTLAPAARRVADVIVADPGLVVSHTISDLAVLCSTSEPSVVRFCRAIGFSGYSQLRMAMATELGREHTAGSTGRNFGEDIRPEDSLGDAVAKVRYTEMMGIQETLDGLDLGVLEAVAEKINAAPVTLIYGVGAGAIVADDLRYKLFRIRRSAVSFRDQHDALMGAALMGPDDVAIAFSHSGRTRETLEFLRRARASGATTVAVSNAAGSPIVQEADLSLFTVVRETAFRSGAMVSRIAQLSVVDCLFVSVARLSYESTLEALETTREAVRGRPDPRREPGPRREQGPRRESAPRHAL
ncbi:MurR/RpiR family transcriptional regulator [Arthrobacter sp. CG_A4]|uniref:MurR/RpiR family transcriptional regulator n=1 Tax=Arthrobacter sp. CG_A4 TaxID=3071706 RepID=UPI002DFECB5B|nr:DNA-binding MurR/RpiR family transcriptional regulator [Arthrobacter sp. CG_A4]